MKKYIGITIFLVSLIVASFWIALSSGKLKININTQENKIKKSNTKTNLTKLDNKVDKQDNTKENNKTEINVNYNS
jgi:cell division protein FtsL